MQIKDVDKLKVWLLKKLEPLCDADPAALAKYVVALLRKEKPKAALKDLCIDQLEVFLAKETTAFVEKLFRCLDSESYMKGEDPPPRTPPTPITSGASSAPSSQPSSLPSATSGMTKSDVTDRSKSDGGDRSDRSKSDLSDRSKSDGADRSDRSDRFDRSKLDVSDRRQSEDRHKEVDDDDRDFRRSRRHDTDMSGGGGSGGGVTRKITAPIGVGGAGRLGLGKKRGLNSLPDMAGVISSSKRRVVMDHSRSAESDGHHRGAGSGGGGVSSSTGLGAGRRPVRERLGPRTDESRSDRLKRGRGGRGSHSSSGSSSSSSSSSGSDSDSSTSRRERGGAARKRRKGAATSSPAAVGVAKGGSVEVKKRQRCKDYDKKGFCILGESCPYDHGLDPLVIDGTIHPYMHHPPPPHPPGMPGMPGGVPTLPPPPPPPDLMSIPPGRHSPPNSKSDSYNPEEPGLSSTTSSGMIPTHIAPPHPMPLRPMFPPPHMPGLMPPHAPHIPGFPPHPHHPFAPTPIITPPMPHQIRPRPHFTAGGGGPRPHLKPSDTLIVRKIPKDLNTITKLSGHFEKFGTIVNLTVRYEGDLEGAMVQFSSPAEAKKAHDNTEAVFNNRFIRIYYLRKDELPPPLPLKEFALEAPVSVAVSHIHASPSSTPPPSSTGAVATVTSSETLPPVQPTPDSSGGPAEPEQQSESADRKVVELSSAAPASSRHIPGTATSSKPSHPHARQPAPPTQQRRRSAEAAKKNLELQKKTQELLQKQIEQQKVLIAKLEKAGKHLSAEEKNKIMKNVKALSSSITKLTEVANKAVLTQKQEKQQQQQQQQQQHPDRRKGVKQFAEDQAGEKTEKKQQALALHKAALKQKADALRKEAHKLGLLSSPSQPLPTSTTTAATTMTTTTASTAAPPAGKGRGKPDLRNKLHGKPRQLLVIGVKEREKLTTYFESFGGLDGVEVDPANNNNLIFTFRNHITATQVVSAGSHFSGKPLIMKWYSPKPRPPLSSLPTVTSSSSNSSLQQARDDKRGDTPTHMALARQESESGAVPTTPTLTKLDPQELHLVEDSDEEDTQEGRAWRR